MEYQLTNKQKRYLTLIVGCKLTKQAGGVWLESSKESFEIAEKLIAKGWLIETTSKYLDPSSNDRSFEITELGIKETPGIQVSEDDFIVESVTHKYNSDSIVEEKQDIKFVDISEVIK